MYYCDDIDIAIDESCYSYSREVLGLGRVYVSR